jgi:hypothetical protein
VLSEEVQGWDAYLGYSVAQPSKEERMGWIDVEQAIEHHVQGAKSLQGDLQSWVACLDDGCERDEGFDAWVSDAEAIKGQTDRLKVANHGGEKSQIKQKEAKTKTKQKGAKNKTIKRKRQ